MTNEKELEEMRERLSSLRSRAFKIVRKMNEHELFGFILLHLGRNAIPELMELWGKSPEPDDGELDDELHEPGAAGHVEALENEDLIQLISKKPAKKGKR